MIPVLPVRRPVATAVPVVFAIVFAASSIIPSGCSRLLPQYPLLTRQIHLSLCTTLRTRGTFERTLNTGGKPVLTNVTNVVFQGLRAEEASCYMVNPSRSKCRARRSDGMQKCDFVSSCCCYHLKFGLVVCYIHPHVLCDNLPGIYLAVVACTRNDLMYACRHWCSTYLFRMAFKTCVWPTHVGIRVARARLSARCSSPSHTCICSLINACMLHDHMLSSKPKTKDKVLIQAKGAVRANNRIRSCTDSPVR